jgi:hypothetical protein
VEATPGTSVAANKLLNSIGIEPGIAVDFQNFRPQGQKFSSIIVPGKEWTNYGISGVGTYSEIVYLLAGLINNPTPVQQAATTAYKWSFSPAARAEDSIKTLTVEQGGAVRAHKFSYALPTEVTFDVSRDGFSIGGAGIGQRITDGIALTGSPTAIEEKPILPQHIDVWLDPTSGGLGTTKLLRVLKVGFTFGNRFNPLWTLDSSQASFAAHVEALPATQLRLMLEADAVGMGLLANMRNGDTRFIRMKATSPDMAGTAIPYSLALDFAGKVSGVSEFSDEDGVYAIEWTFDVVYDATWTKAFQIDVINKQTAL